VAEQAKGSRGGVLVFLEQKQKDANKSKAVIISEPIVIPIIVPVVNGCLQFTMLQQVSELWYLQ
jgi:hypothetical protein